MGIGRGRGRWGRRGRRGSEGGVGRCIDIVRYMQLMDRVAPVNFSVEPGSYAFIKVHF